MFSQTASVLAADGSPALGNNLILIVLFAAMILLLFVLPARRQKKYVAELQERQNRMVPGTRVKTNWGLYGTIVSLNEASNTVQLEVAPGTVIEVDRKFVTELVEEVATEPGTDEK